MINFDVVYSDLDFYNPELGWDFHQLIKQNMLPLQ